MGATFSHTLLTLSRPLLRDWAFLRWTHRRGVVI